MIIFKKVRWKNILSTGNSMTEVDLNTHNTTLIVGENGAGKSTILDAICFALFNRPFRQVSKTQLLNSINEQNGEVQVEFSIGTKEYKIIRCMKPNKFEIYCDNLMLNQDASNLDYQKHLEQSILKLNYRSFTQVVILGSSTFVPFMKLSSSHRREVVEDILDIKIFSSMNLLVKNKIKEINDDIKSIDDNTELTLQKIELQEQYINDLEQNKDKIIKNNNEKINSNKKTISKYSSDKTDLENLNDGLLTEVLEQSNISNKLKKLNKLHSTISTKKSREEKDVEFFMNNDECPTCNQVITNQFKTNVIKQREDKVSEYQDGLNDLDIEIQNLENRLQIIEQISIKLNENNVKIGTLSTSIDTLLELNESLNKEIKEYEELGSTQENRKKLEKLKDSLLLFEQRKAKLIEDKHYHDIARNMLQDSGIKTKIIKKYLPIMNKLINGYLSSMDFFINFTIDENFNEIIKSRYRDEFKYYSFSEGEKMRIDLGLLFTWRAIAKMKNSTNTNLLLLDEIFDSSLDGTGTDDFLKILNTFKDENVFVISHKGDVLVDKFDHTIKFEKIQNFSKIVES
ncbi:MAG: hypothetical protein CBE47_01415 [Pelagibacteraceae bacterium TMED287]|nr:MAG: hypothetical protein CBE47_01415 [Pelagibacteraceae bacterium TMED287]